MHERRDAAILARAVRPCNSPFRGMSAVRGKPAEIEAIVKRLKAVKGLKHVSLAAGTTGVRLP